MSPGDFFDGLTPHARAATALTLFLGAFVLRVLSKNGFSRAILLVSTMWFAMNVLMAPYSMEMRREILSLRWRIW
jgi:hypothetical protein